MAGVDVIGFIPTTRRFVTACGLGAERQTGAGNGGPDRIRVFAFDGLKFGA
ncbi:MAG: hypothetical protein ACK5X3_11015 [Pseudomonadota bacterium]